MPPEIPPPKSENPIAPEPEKKPSPEPKPSSVPEPIIPTENQAQPEQQTQTDQQPAVKPQQQAARKTIEDKAQTDSQFAHVVEQHEIQSVEIEGFIADRIDQGKDLPTIGKELKEAVERGGRFSRNSTLEATRLLTLIAMETENPELFVEPGVGSKDFKLYEEAELPPIESATDGQGSEGGQALNGSKEKALKQRQHDTLIHDLQEFDEEIERLGLVDSIESKKILRNIGVEILEGEKSKTSSHREGNKIIQTEAPPKYNKDETKIITERIKNQRELLEAEQQAKRMKGEMERKKEQQERKAKAEAERQMREQAKRDQEEQRRTEQDFREEKYSSLYLSRTEEVLLAIDPTETAQAWIRKFYEPYGYPAGGEDESQRRVQMFMGYMQGDQYRDEHFALRDYAASLKRDIKSLSVQEAKEFLTRWHASGENYNGITPIDFSDSANKQKKDDFHYMLRGQKEFVEKHTTLKLAAAAIDNGAKIENIVNQVASGGDSMWHEVASANRGMNELAYRLYVQELEIARGTNTTALKRIDGPAIERAKQRFIQEMSTNPLYQTEAFYGKPISAEEAEYFYNVARSLARVRQKTALALIKAAGSSEMMPEGVKPLFDAIDLQQSSFSDSSTDEMIAASMDWVRFFTEKWGNLTPGQKRMVDFIYEFSAIDAGFESKVNEKIEKLKKNGTYQKERQGAIEKRWGHNHEDWNETHPTGGFFSKIFGSKVGFNEDIEYKKILLREEGRRVFGEVLEMYDHDTSTWRVQTQLQQIASLYKDGDTRGLGLWLRRAGADFLNARDDAVATMFREGKKSELEERQNLWKIGQLDVASTRWDGEPISVEKILKVIADYQPQRTGLMLYEQSDAEFLQFLAKAETKDAIQSLGVSPDKGFAAVNDVVMSYYININAMLENRGLPTINFQKGLAGITDPIIRSQTEAILKMVIEGNGTTGYKPQSADSATTVESFMDFMKLLSSQTGTQVEIDAFMRPEFRQYLKRTQWTDDISFRHLEHPEELALKISDGVTEVPSAIKSHAHDRTPLSKIFAQEGEGRRSSLARTWGDMMMGMEIVREVLNALSPDKEKLMKALEKIKANESAYSGNDAALRSAVYLTTGWLKMSETDPAFMRSLELGFLPNTSEMKRYFGDEAASLSEGGIDKVLDKLDYIHSKLNLSHSVKETVFKAEKYLHLAYSIGGMKFGRESKLSPLWMKRYQLFMIMLVILAAAESGKTVKKSVEEMGGKK